MWHYRSGGLDNQGRFYSARASDGSSWTEARMISPNDHWPSTQLIVDAEHDRLYSAASDRIFIYERVSTPPGSVRAEQTVQIPATMVSPTLTFYCKSQLQYSDTFSVLVNAQQVVWEKKSCGEEWQYHWVDLSAWRGQTVRIVFSLNGTSHSMVRLDEVTLGEWKTPYVSDVRPATITPNQPITLELVGKNFGAAAPTVRVAGQTIGTVVMVNPELVRIYLPNGLPVGRHNLTVINGDGYEGRHFGIIRVGQERYLPLVTRKGTVSPTP